MYLYKDNLKECREEKDIKAKDMANILKICNSTYSCYENEHYIIPIKHLNTLCNYFDVSFDYIFNFTTLKKYNNQKGEIDLKMAGLRLKEFRKSLKLNQEGLSNILNCSQTIISKIELGNRLIATPFLYDICKKYNISADYLLGRINSPKYLK